MKGSRVVCVLVLIGGTGAIAADLNLRITSGFSSSVVVAPGATVEYRVDGVLSDQDNQGLALALFDLAFDGGALGPADTPAAAPMSNFVLPLGITNPGGYGGTVMGGALLQVGGIQNTIGNSVGNAPYPTGPVLTGVAHGWQVLVAGSLTAPVVEGVYTLSVSNVIAAAITQDATGVPFWATQPAAPGSVDNLIVEVSADPLLPAQAAALGPRYLGAAPPPGVGLVALLLTGDPFNPDVSCLSSYVQSDGTLGAAPAFQDSDVWGTVAVSGPAILPGTGYAVRVDYGGELSIGAVAVTHQWGNPINDGTINIFDLLCVLAVFAGNFDQCSFYEADMFGAGDQPDGTINIFDLLSVLSAFAGDPYPGPAPCSPP